MQDEEEALRIIQEVTRKHPGRDQVRWLDDTCAYCGKQLNSWDQRIANALLISFDACEECVAKDEYGMTVEDFRAKMRERFGMEPCKGI